MIDSIEDNHAADYTSVNVRFPGYGPSRLSRLHCRPPRLHPAGARRPPSPHPDSKHLGQLAFVHAASAPCGKLQQFCCCSCGINAISTPRSKHERAAAGLSINSYSNSKHSLGPAHGAPWPDPPDRFWTTEPGSDRPGWVRRVTLPSEPSHATCKQF